MSRRLRADNSCLVMWDRFDSSQRNTSQRAAIAFFEDSGWLRRHDYEATTHCGFNDGTDICCSSIAHKFGSRLARLAGRWMGLARGGARGSSSRYRARCAAVLRRLRLRLPGLQLWLWDRLQLPELRLWQYRLQLPELRLWLWR